MNLDKLEARSSPGQELALTPALSPRRGRIMLRQFETTDDSLGSPAHLGKLYDNSTEEFQLVGIKQ
jgi:hypothetical protein